MANQPRLLNPGDVISYDDLCEHAGARLQRGMNFRLNGGMSVILMSTRSDARYADKVLENGRVLIYEGHDVPRQEDKPDPKEQDQQPKTLQGRLTQNGLFYKAAVAHMRGIPAEQVKVYEKIDRGLWVYWGVFDLVGAWIDDDRQRSVFKFKLKFNEQANPQTTTTLKVEHTRVIPSAVKAKVWQRDKGRCVLCGSQENLHFDHVIPFSKGGSSLTAENIQLLCATHNLAKSNKVQ